MADTPTVNAPTISGTIDQTFFLTPLNGPDNPSSYLDNFPSQIYNTSIDSRLVKFMYSLLGPSGLGWIQKNYLQARLVLEDYGVEGFDLDGFYGDPLRFARVLEETYSSDLSSLISREDWNEIQAKDAKYRSRALNYVTGIRAGNTPLGMQYVAKSGLGHDASIIENYKYLYDQHSDSPIGLNYKGSTLSTEEMIVVPRQEVPQSEVQTISIFGNPTGGSFQIFFPQGDPNSPGSDATQATEPIILTNGSVDRGIIQSALESLPAIGQGNVTVTDGPLPDTSVTLTFSNNLSYKDVPQLQISVANLTGGTDVDASIDTVVEGVPVDVRSTAIPTIDQHYLLTALGYIKPVTTIVTFTSGNGKQTVQTWDDSPTITSSYREVVKYVTGNPTIKWPAKDSIHWVESGIEHKALRVFDDLQYHYQGFHNIARTIAYTDEAVSQDDYSTSAWDDSFRIYRSEHVGNFTNLQRTLFSNDNVEYGNKTFIASDGIALYPEPITTTSSNTNEDGAPTQLVNGIYPADYLNLPGVNIIADSGIRFWASKQRSEGSDYLEIDLGSVQAINYLIFEISNKPCDIEIDYDVLDSGSIRRFVPVTQNPMFPVSSTILFDSVQQNPWRSIEFLFGNAQNRILYTRYLRIKLTRRGGLNSPFISQAGQPVEYSLEIKNLRLGRNI